MAKPSHAETVGDVDSELERFVDEQLSGQQKLEAAYRQAQVMNAEGQDGVAYYEGVRHELFSDVLTRLDALED